jgi:hypothetical protein
MLHLHAGRVTTDVEAAAIHILGLLDYGFVDDRHRLLQLQDGLVVGATTYRPSCEHPRHAPVRSIPA